MGPHQHARKHRTGPEGVHIIDPKIGEMARNYKARSSDDISWADALAWAKSLAVDNPARWEDEPAEDEAEPVVVSLASAVHRLEEAIIDNQIAHQAYLQSQQAVAEARDAVLQLATSDSE